MGADSGTATDGKLLGSNGGSGSLYYSTGTPYIVSSSTFYVLGGQLFLGSTRICASVADHFLNQVGTFDICGEILCSAPVQGQAL